MPNLIGKIKPDGTLRGIISSAVPIIRGQLSNAALRGMSVQLQIDGTLLQWKYEDSDTWTDLIDLNDLDYEQFENLPQINDVILTGNKTSEDLNLASRSEGITSITRDGTTFTVTRPDGTTFTFDQQDNDTTYEEATESNSGLMSSEDKTKLDNIQVGSQANIIESISINGVAQTINQKNVDIAVPLVDDTLTNVGQAADAKATGDALDSMVNNIQRVADEIPTNVSELNNDSNYINKNYVDNELAKKQDTFPFGVPTSEDIGKALMPKTVENGVITEWEFGEAGMVDDVRINGTSVVENKIANIPIANSLYPGVVKVSSGFGLKINSHDNNLEVEPADDTSIKIGGGYAPITPGNQDKATFYGLASAAGDRTQWQSSNSVGTYTDSAKASIQSMLGVDSLIATPETNPASSFHPYMGMFMLDGKLCRAKEDIEIGDTITLGVGGNAKVVTMASMIETRLQEPSTPGTAGQVLTSDGNGGQAWEDPASAAQIEANKNDITDLKSAVGELNELTLKAQSSVVSADSYGSLSTNRVRLNPSPLSSNLILGNLHLVANDDLINGTLTIELTHFANGSYTVYAAKTVNMSGATIRGDLVNLGSIGLVTSGETYIFISTSITARFRMARGITGSNLVESPDKESATFTTSITPDYEVMYQVDYAATEKYLKTLTNGLHPLLVDVEIPDSVLFKNVGYYFNNNTAEMESAGSNDWVVSDYIPVGNGITVTGSAYSKYRPQIVEYDSTYNIIGQEKLGAIGSVTKTYLPGGNVAFVRLQSTITTGNIASGTQKVYEPVPMVYHVEKDGSGDFTNLATAIAEATRRMDAVVYVGAGTWDILEDLGADYLAHMSAFQGGIVLKNRVHVICSSKAYIKCLYSGSDANVINYLSAFNAGKYGFILENADIEVANVRYCVHDERNAETDHYDNYYINCRMKNTNNTSGSRSQCIGGGLGYDGHVVIDGCTFENPLRENYGIVSYHNAHGAATDSRSLIEVKGSYFYGKNTFRAGYYGNTTKITQCLVHGNSMGAEPYMTQEDQSFTNVNMEIVAWNNEIRSV